MPAKPLNQLSGMPQMGAAFSGWFVPIQIEKIIEFIVDGFVNYDFTPIKFRGVFQPFGPNQLKLKPEGQRSWQWVQIHAEAGSLNLDNGDKIVHAGVRYKVMAQNDYSLNGFIEYHLIQDFGTGTPAPAPVYIVDGSESVVDGEP